MSLDTNDAPKGVGTFHHPYTPYDIQVDFMSSLYETLETKKVGIFESPTGTGKTLSLICASITWLRDQKRRQLRDSLKRALEGDEPEWVKRETYQIRLEEYETRLQVFEKHLEKIREVEKIEKLKAQRAAERKLKHRKVDSSSKDLDDDAQYILEDPPGENAPSDSGYSSKVQKLLRMLASQSVPEEEDLADPIPVKIFFASRTHSQLSQFVSQLSLPRFPPAMSLDETKIESTKHISLGSRKQLCVHPRVSTLGDVNLINDACMDMQKSGSDRTCAFMKRAHVPEERAQVNMFRDKALAHIRDIEDLAQLGSDEGVCPYYGSRAALANSEVVTLPYQLLLQKSSRESLGIDVTDSVIVIDEAHNLLDTISSLSSVTVSTSEVHRALEGLRIYWKKFAARVSPANRTSLSQTIKSVAALHKFMVTSEAKPKSETRVGGSVRPTSIFEGTTMDLANPYKLERFLRDSKLAFKVDSYLEKLESVENKENQANAAQLKPVKRLVLSKVVSFLLAISNPSNEGTILFGKSESRQLELQYLLLDPSEQFREIVEKARCVILAGGTMEPMEDYVNYLLPYLASDKIEKFSCGHIVPDKHLTLSAVSHGRDESNPFLFTFANRNNDSMIEQIGLTMIDLCKRIPRGVVVFLPSYDHLARVTDIWKRGGAHSMWERISQIKTIFSESRGSSSVESTLAEYGAAIDSKAGGALMLSVVGGKLGEGINFSDDLARAVIMVGLPFPSMFSAEMIAKREFIEASVVKRGGTAADGREASRQYYENICMRAVNQCIGRAIRHINDHAAVLLIDSRYTGKLSQKLPGWLRGHLAAKPQSYSGMLSSLEEFYKRF